MTTVVQPKRRGRPRLSPEEAKQRRLECIEEARQYQASKRAEGPEARSALNQRVRECRARYPELYRLKNIEAVRAYRQRKKEASKT